MGKAFKQPTERLNLQFTTLLQYNLVLRSEFIRFGYHFTRINFYCLSIEMKRVISIFK